MHLTLFDLARRINPIVRGWMQYYGAFYRSELHPLLHRINTYLMRWVRKKYRSRRPTRAGSASRASTRGSSPSGHGHQSSGDQEDKSRVTGDCYARFCGSPGVRFPRATRPSSRPLWWCSRGDLIFFLGVDRVHAVFGEVTAGGAIHYRASR
ncbi:group II intron maturase-specific domain-containing protein [Streptomyces sp. NPDC059003]|uniref:group II intron maturase-specific domain-containing protein n=1 Tax=Streptomyces sp. NPDC059003 TaxID=3346691 RepID=UPI0036CC03B8